MLIACAQDELEVRRHRDLVLEVDAVGHGASAVVRVGLARPEGDRPGDRGTVHRRGYRRRGPVEESGVADVAAHLPADLDAAEEGVAHRAGGGAVGRLGLVEQVGPVAVVVVGRQRHQLAGRVHRAGEDVLVKLVVVAEQHPVADLERGSQVMLDGRGRKVDPGVGPALRRVAEEGTGIGGRRGSAERRNAAVRRAIVVEVLEAGRDAGGGAEQKRPGRIQAVPLDVHVAPEAVRVLVHAVEAEGHLLGHTLADVHGAAAGAVRAALHGQLAGRRPFGLLGDAVDHPAAGAAAEDEGVGALQRLDPLHVVEVAEVLDVVADAVQEERRGRVVAADRRLVAVPLTLAHRDPGHVARDVGHALHALVGDERPADHRH